MTIQGYDDDEDDDDDKHDYGCDVDDDSVLTTAVLY